MNLLAVETSSETGSVALLTGDILVERTSPPATSHSAWVLPAVRALLAEAGLPLSRLDAIAFGNGPGAFTGLRLACGVAQGLALGSGLPVLPVDSLAALALGSGEARVYAAVDARMNEVYFAAYELADGEARCVLPPGCGAPEAVGLPAGEGWAGCGSAFRAYPQALAARLGSAVVPTDAQARPTAAAVARLGATLWRQGGAIDAGRIAPAYVRDKVAFTTAERLARGGRA